MKILIDTNIALDVLLKREPFYEDAAKVILLSEKDIIDAYVSASAVTDIYYVARKYYKDKAVTSELLKKLLQVIYVATITDDNIYKALNLEWNDFEDSVQYIVGESIEADYIITRNPGHFSNSSIKVINPNDFLNIITSM
ncbi:twitching motility protein PilT [Bacteroidia bacterium]|nr:twitching motility protein PilT [Bacteroidia bacterium]